MLYIRDKNSFELILSLDLENEGHLCGASGLGFRVSQQDEGPPSYPVDLILAGRAFTE